MKYLLLTGLSVLVTSSLCAADADDLSFSLNGNGSAYAVSDCSENASGTLDIPSSYNNLPITVIASNAFKDCNSLTKITLPQSITTIESNAFQNCTSLSSFTITDNVSLIESNAFRDCRSLIKCYFTGPAPTVDSNAFKDIASGAVAIVSRNNLDSFGGEGARWKNIYVISLEGDIYTQAQYNAVVAQRDARPTQTAYNTVVAERDARPTQTEYRPLLLLVNAQ